MTAPDPVLDALRYPIGRFSPNETLADAERSALVGRLATLPARLRAAVAGLDDAALDTPCRPGGWTVRQVVHHLPDSHVNGYVRFRLAATEEDPTIRPYEQALWAELGDRSAPVEVSLALLEALHARWVGWLRTLGPREWRRAYRHPESGLATLDESLQLYAWHGDHHLAQVVAARARIEARAGRAEGAHGSRPEARP